LPNREKLRQFLNQNIATTVLRRSFAMTVWVASVVTFRGGAETDLVNHDRGPDERKKLGECHVFVLKKRSFSAVFQYPKRFA
jgi:hypothetical protein